MKKAVARAAIDYIEAGSIVGVGTGSTANYFIDELAKIKNKIETTEATASPFQDPNAPSSFSAIASGVTSPTTTIAVTVFPRIWSSPRSSASP